jgi:hypothetical protein
MGFDPSTAKPLSAYPGADAATSAAMDATDAAGGIVDVTVGPDGKVTDKSTAKGQFNPNTAKPFNPATANLVVTPKQEEKPVTPDSTTDKIIKGTVGAAVAPAEAALAMGSGMLAKPISDVMGLVATIKDMASGESNDAVGFKRMIQEALTYEPRTTAGKVVAEYNPVAMAGKGISAVAGGTRNLIAPEKTSGPLRDAIGRGVEEAIVQVPGLLGPRAAAATDSAATALRQSARDMMQSALKPPLRALETRGPSGAAAGIDTMLDEGINVSRGGMETLQGRVAEINNRISTAIANSPAIVNKQLVATRLNSALDRFEMQVAPLTDIRAIQRAHDEFMNHPLLPGNGIPVRLAQEMKQGTYRALGDRVYGELSGADVTAQKALARGLKEEIAAVVPEVAPLNAQESRLLNALNLTERRVLMEANKNPMGLGWLSTNPAKMAAFMADRSGLFKSIVARMLNTSSEAVSSISPIVAPVSTAVGADSAKEKFQNYLNQSKR